MVDPFKELNNAKYQPAEEDRIEMAFRVFSENYDKWHKKGHKADDMVDTSFKRVNQFIHRYLEEHAR